MDGNDVAIVDVSWTAKPCDRSSRCMRFRCPPDFGAWADAGAAPAKAAASPRDIASATMRVERVMVLVSLIRLLGRNGNSRMVAGKPSQNIRHRRWSDNPSTGGVMHRVKPEA